jgi:ABC-type Na+ transport system ATPase subunit NatA
MIEAHQLTKRYGDKTAVEDLSFTVRPGIVTGFLAPNGAGKSTTMRMILGLDAPTSGSVTVNGRAYVDHPAPLHQVGALLDAEAVHTGRSAADHLRVMAATTGIGRGRVEEIIDLVGLREVAEKRAGTPERSTQALACRGRHGGADARVARARRVHALPRSLRRAVTRNRAAASCGVPRASRRGED